MLYVPLAVELLPPAGEVTVAVIVALSTAGLGPNDAVNGIGAVFASPVYPRKLMVKCPSGIALTGASVHRMDVYDALEENWHVRV